MSDDTKPRFSFEMSESQRLRSVKYLGNYGIRRAIFSKILDDVLDMIEDHGGIAIGILMTDNVKPREIIPSIQEAEQAVNKIKNGG
jgi:hypothetical protein